VIYALYQDEGDRLAQSENKKSCFALVEQFWAKIFGPNPASSHSSTVNRIIVILALLPNQPLED